MHSACVYGGINIHKTYPQQLAPFISFVFELEKLVSERKQKERLLELGIDAHTRAGKVLTSDELVSSKRDCLVLRVRALQTSFFLASFSGFRCTAQIISHVIRFGCRHNSNTKISISISAMHKDRENLNLLLVRQNVDKLPI